MSGTTTNPNANAPNTTKNYDADIFTGERSEFGMLVFSDPHRQATYEHHETKYKKTYDVKQAYDKQEFLRKMRADIKREYLTRKKQIKRLQRDAAVDFRNAEMSIQEHYASASAQGQRHWKIHGVDINAPLVSQIQLPHGETLDLKTLQCDTEFAKVFGIHEDLRLDLIESIRIHEEEEQRQRKSEAENEASWSQWTQQQRPYEPRGAFGGCYDNGDNGDNDAGGHWECHDANCSTCGHDDDDDSYVGEEQQQQQQQQQQQEEEPQGRYGDGGFCGCGDLECSDCFSYRDENDNDKDSYDSSYCEEFGHYPREYNWERECREAEEARAAAQAAAEQEQQRWVENTRNSDGETWDEEAIANEAEHRREVAQMKLDGDMTYTCDDYPDVQQLEHIQVTEPKERFTASAAAGGMISAQKKAAAGAAAKAAKARQAKQQQKKLQKKFAPLQITPNTNRVPVPVPVCEECRDMEEEWSDNDLEQEQPQQEQTTTLLYQGRAQVNLPKKNLQNVSREGKRRHIAIWKRIETDEKHASARGTRIANIPEPMSWHNCGGSDNEYDC